MICQQKKSAKDVSKEGNFPEHKAPLQTQEELQKHNATIKNTTREPTAQPEVNQPPMESITAQAQEKPPQEISNGQQKDNR